MFANELNVYLEKKHEQVTTNYFKQSLVAFNIVEQKAQFVGP